MRISPNAPKPKLHPDTIKQYISNHLYFTWNYHLSDLSNSTVS